MGRRSLGGPTTRATGAVMASSSIGQRLAALRRPRRMSQADLAVAAEVSVETIRKLERGHGTPPGSTPSYGSRTPWTCQSPKSWASPAAWRPPAASQRSSNYAAWS
ncbi:MAG: hypothetical protein DLM59_10880 [Pseudonocardiales bacterium]|nr:MAG: hypothetical protein DLM59_10880 [Pseudonocardiales bacterium]